MRSIKDFIVILLELRSGTLIKPRDPRELAIDLIPRSICQTRVAAVVCDASGNIISWGWNSSGPTGLGLHAEVHAIRRANRNRLWYGTVYVAGAYDRGTLVKAKPCEKCQQLIDKFNMEVFYRDKSGRWNHVPLTL